MLLQSLLVNTMTAAGAVVVLVVIFVMMVSIASRLGCSVVVSVLADVVAHHYVWYLLPNHCLQRLELHRDACLKLNLRPLVPKTTTQTF